MFRFFKEKKPLPDEKIVHRGNWAKGVLESGNFQKLLEEIEGDLWEGFLLTPVSGSEDRELLYRHIAALTSIRNKLFAYVEQGQLAEHILNEKKRREEVKNGKPKNNP